MADTEMLNLIQVTLQKEGYALPPPMLADSADRIAELEHSNCHGAYSEETKTRWERTGCARCPASDNLYILPGFFSLGADRMRSILLHESLHRYLAATKKAVAYPEITKHRNAVLSGATANILNAFEDTLINRELKAKFNAAPVEWFAGSEITPIVEDEMIRGFERDFPLHIRRPFAALWWLIAGAQFFSCQTPKYDGALARAAPIFRDELKGLFETISPKSERGNLRTKLLVFSSLCGIACGYDGASKLILTPKRENRRRTRDVRRALLRKGTF